MVLLVCSGALVNAAASSLSTASAEDIPDAEPRDGHTVVTESGRAGTITVYAPDGEAIYYNNTRTKYFDVDPVDGDPMTIEYTATDTLNTGGPMCEQPPCAHNYVERLNLSTGEVEVVFERVNDQERAGEWHDHVRVNDTHILIADIRYDEVYLVNTETEIVEWLWDAQSDFEVDESGNWFPRDWTHLNDIELLEDGRIMASLRNHDRVVFIDPDSGVDHDWTLGAEDNYDILYEQHNPDYIPEERGGPAVVVADSENNRVQEFQREDGSWTRTWEWSDDRLQWPRDADRLPNGNTLIADTHGSRVMEVTPDGDIEWQVGSTLPYDAERLEAGGGSSGGHSARELGLESREAGSDTQGGPVDGGELVEGVVQAIVPHWIYNGLLYVTPVWVRGPEVAVIGLAVVTGLGWVGSEIRWRLGDVGIGFRSPVYRRGSDQTDAAEDGEPENADEQEADEN